MQVKVKNKIYDGNNEPVMVILSKEDKENIANMPDDHTKYCSYPENYSKEKAKKFMRTE